MHCYVIHMVVSKRFQFLSAQLGMPAPSHPDGPISCRAARTWLTSPPRSTSGARGREGTLDCAEPESASSRPCVAKARKGEVSGQGTSEQRI